MSNMLTPIQIPEEVELDLENNRIKVTGPRGELEHRLPGVLELHHDPEAGELRVERHRDDRHSRSLHGLHRSLVANMIEGVTRGYEKKMEIHGTGYNVQERRGELVLEIGFCHPVEMQIPEGIEMEIEQNSAQPDNPARFTLRGPDKQKLGQFAADVRDVRPPEPYKGKGIRYADEHVRRKEGKAFAGLE